MFFGKLLTGWPNAVLAPLLGIAILVLAYGMWNRRRFALPMSQLYAVFVTPNVPLFLVFEGIPPAFGPFAYFVFSLVAVGGGLARWVAPLAGEGTPELRIVAAGTDCFGPVRDNVIEYIHAAITATKVVARKSPMDYWAYPGVVVPLVRRRLVATLPRRV